MHSFIRKNPTLVIGLAIPVLMILFVAAAIYIPSLFADPKTDFLYTVNEGRYYGYGGPEYTIENGKIRRNPPVYPVDYPKPQEDVPSPLYVHDVESNTSRQLTFEEAGQLTLDSSNASPDGWEIARGGRGGDFFPFIFNDNYDYNSVYLVGHNTSKKMNLSSRTGDNYYYNFEFIAWIRD